MLPFTPDEALYPRIEVVHDALLTPYNDPNKWGRTLVGGVHRSDLSFVENSLVFISETRQVNRFQRQVHFDDLPVIPGTWLFGGKHDSRFGHFLVETLSRLWALDYFNEPVAGIAFIPPKIMNPKSAERKFQASSALFDLVEGLPRLSIFTEKARFERLVVPPQGCGAGMMAPGCPEFRAFISKRFAPRVLPDGPKKLYVSRTKMLHTPGHLLFEQLIESSARSEGYEIYHPQDHSAQDQVAKYRAAEYILGVEGSAFHMIAFSARPSANIAMIRRRMGNVPEFFIEQITRVSHAKCVDVNCLTENFFIPGTAPIANGTPDLVELYGRLNRENFFTKKHSVFDLSQEMIAAEKDRVAAQMTAI